MKYFHSFFFFLPFSRYEYPDESINVYLTSVSYAGVELDALGTLNQAVVTIGDDGDAGTLEFSTSNYFWPESDTEQEVNITVLRTGRSVPDGNIICRFSSTDNTAISTGVDNTQGLLDYDPVAGELVFVTGERSKTFAVKVLQDDYYEYPDEKISLRLYDLRYQAIAEGTYEDVYSLQFVNNDGNSSQDNATITIVDDGDAGTVSFADSVTSVSEDLLLVTITLTRRNGDSQAIQVDVVPEIGTGSTTTSLNDLSTTTQTLLFGSGINLITTTWAVVNDNIFEYPDETFNLTLSNIRYTASPDIANIASLHIGHNDNEMVVTILDDGDLGTFNFLVTSFQVQENDACPVHAPGKDSCFTTATYTVTRTGRLISSKNVTLFWRTRSLNDNFYLNGYTASNEDIRSITSESITFVGQDEFSPFTNYLTWTFTLSSTAIITAAQNVTVSQNNGYMLWTITLRSPLTATQAQGVTVTQASNTATGELFVALTNTAVSVILIKSEIGQVFDVTADLVIGTGGSVTTVVPYVLSGATSLTTDHASGTLFVALDGSAVSTVVVRSALGQTFDTDKDLVIDTTPTTIDTIAHTVLATVATVKTDLSNEMSFDVAVYNDDHFEYPDEKFGVELFDIAYDTAQQGNAAYGVEGLVRYETGSTDNRAYFLHIGTSDVANVTVQDDGDAGVIQMRSSQIAIVEPSSYIDPQALTSVTVTLTRALGVNRLARLDGNNPLFNPKSNVNYYGNLSVLYTTVDQTAIGNLSEAQPQEISTIPLLVQEIGSYDYHKIVANSVLFPDTGVDSPGHCDSGTCQTVAIAIFSDRQYEGGFDEACNCMDCGTTVANAGLTTGSCGVAIDTCNAGTSGAGCYTECATSCDCSTNRCEISGTGSACTSSSDCPNSGGCSSGRCCVTANCAEESFKVQLHDLTYNSQTLSEVVLSSDSFSDVVITDDGDMGTVGFCSYTSCTSCTTDADFQRARTTNLCDGLSVVAPWPQSQTTGRELKQCGTTGNLQCNKLPSGVSYYYQVPEGADFTVAYKRWSASGFDEQLHIKLKLRYEGTATDPAEIDLGFTAYQRDTSGNCYTASQVSAATGTQADSMTSDRVPFSNTAMRGGATSFNTEDVIIDSCTTVSGLTSQAEERSFMEANPWSNPSMGLSGATINPEDSARNNWWYTWYKFTAVDDNNILADQIFTFELSLDSVSERVGSTSTSTGHQAGVTFGNSKIALYIVDNDGGSAAICATRGCITCTATENNGECSSADVTTSEYLTNIPNVVEGEDESQFFVVLLSRPAQEGAVSVQITVTPTSDVYRLKNDNDISFMEPGAPIVLTFQKSNWQIPQGVNVLATDDEENRGTTYSGTITFTSDSDDDAFAGTLEFYSLGNNAQSSAGFSLSGQLTDNDVGQVVQFSLDTDDGTLSISQLGAVPTFSQKLLGDIARALGIDVSRLSIRSITEGSVVFSIAIAPAPGDTVSLDTLVENFYTMLSDKASKLYSTPTFSKYATESRSVDDTQDIGGTPLKTGSTSIRVDVVRGRGGSQGRHYLREGRRPMLKTDDVTYEVWIVLDTKPVVNCDLAAVCHVCAASDIKTGGSVVCKEPRSSGEDSDVVVLISADGTTVRIVEPTGTTDIPNSAELRFSATNWMIPQRVILKGIDDKSATTRMAGSITLAATSRDSRYDTTTVTSAALFNLNEIASRFVHVLDNDVAGISVISSQGSSATIREGSVPAVDIEIVLESQPSSNVIIDVDHFFAPETLLVTPSLVSGRRLITFTTTDWSTPKIVSVRAADNDITATSSVVPLRNYLNLWSESLDLRYHQASVRHFSEGGSRPSRGAISIDVVENDLAKIQTSCGVGAYYSCALMEDLTLNAIDNSGIRYTMSLTSQPRDPVVITLEEGTVAVVTNNARSTHSVPTGALTFDETNWYVPQYMGLRLAQNLYRDEDSITSTMHHSTASNDVQYNGPLQSSTTATSNRKISFEKHNVDTNGIVVGSPPLTSWNYSNSPSGVGMASFEDGLISLPIRLSSKPTHEVRVFVTINDPTRLEFATGSVITFSVTSWNLSQYVVLRAKRNSISDVDGTTTPYTSISLRSSSADLCYDTSGNVRGGEAVSGRTRSKCDQVVTTKDFFVEISLKDIDATNALSVQFLSSVHTTSEDAGGDWSTTRLRLTTKPNVPTIAKLGTAGVVTRTVEGKPWRWFTTSGWWRERVISLRTKTNLLKQATTSTWSQALTASVETITEHLSSPSVLNQAVTDTHTITIVDDDVPTMLTGYDDVQRQVLRVREGGGHCAGCRRPHQSTGSSTFGQGGSVCVLLGTQPGVADVHVDITPHDPISMRLQSGKKEFVCLFVCLFYI